MPDITQPAEAGFFTPEEIADVKFSPPVAPLESRFIEAIERWYAAHFHRCALAGVAPISADDKSALVASVTALEG